MQNALLSQHCHLSLFLSPFISILWADNRSTVPRMDGQWYGSGILSLVELKHMVAILGQYVELVGQLKEA